tara:strand:+ start:418 stop:669 length:252 start_codon:yes stop_codon:yes gene_type:complete
MIGKLEVHIKYMDDWMCSAEKENVSDAHIGHAINMLSLQIEKSIEDMLSGKIKLKDLPKAESHGMSMGMVPPDKKEFEYDTEN